MKTAKTTTKLFATAIALLVAGVLWFAWGSRQAQAIQGSEDFSLTDWDHQRADRTPQRAQYRREARDYHKW
jgi:hypothetical protein